MDLSYNNFTPQLFPSWAKKLQKLHTLHLRGVSLTGEVSSDIFGRFKSLETLGLNDNNMSGTLNINYIVEAMAKENVWSLKCVSLKNNKIVNVAYSERIDKLDIKFNLSENPYCTTSANSGSDLKRCVCHQQCFYTGNLGNNTYTIIAVPVVVCSVLLFAVYNYFFCRGRRASTRLIHEANQKFAEYEVKPTIYTFPEIRMITDDFHPDKKLGQGHYGAVYEGILANGTPVAVKQLFSKSQQSLDVFLNEVVLVAAVKHRNLVKLKGCCIRRDQRLLVHEYVELGDLEKLLLEHKSNVNMSWAVRKNICLGVAHGIHYLHSLAQPRIIHRDIKASNILLDKNLEPKIADFGLALLFPDDQSHIMTIHVAGTRGYLAPEYATLGQLSEKVDVYSYGILLLEIVGGRKNIDRNLPEDKVYLLDWAWKLREEGKLSQLTDASLQPLQIDEEMDVQRILNIAFLCVQMSAEKRPNMASVVSMLQGGMDSDISDLIRLRDTQSRLENRFDGPLPFTISSPSSTIVLPVPGAPNAFVRTSLTGSRDGLLSSVSKSTELINMQWIR